MAVRKTDTGLEDGELYFEMEFPLRGGDSDTSSFSSKSIESFTSELTAPNSRESSYHEPSDYSMRPSSLHLGTHSTLPSTSHRSLPRTQSHHTPPKLQFQSVPNTPGDPWSQDDHFLHSSRHLSSSVSSVEESRTETIKPATSKSRLSLNLGVFDPGSPSRSPRILPKFLRSSISKLIQSGKDRVRTPDIPSSMESMSLPFLSSVMSRSRCQTPDEEDTPAAEDSSPPSTPTTKTFVEESVAAGLPIIPFQYPTFVILERRRESARQIQQHNPLPPPLPVARPEDTPRCGRTVSAPVSRKCSHATQYGGKEGEPGHNMEDKSLSNLLTVARQQMEREASVNETPWIRGYASNNSRALYRRRSSMSDYVTMAEHSLDIKESQEYNNKEDKDNYYNKDRTVSSSKSVSEVMSVSRGRTHSGHKRLPCYPEGGWGNNSKHVGYIDMEYRSVGNTQGHT